MTTRTKHPTLRVIIWARMPSSINGNPRFRCVLESPEGAAIAATTRPDSSLAYAAPSRPSLLTNAVISTTPSGRVYLDNCDFSC